MQRPLDESIILYQVHCYESISFKAKDRYLQFYKCCLLLYLIMQLVL